MKTRSLAATAAIISALVVAAPAGAVVHTLNWSNRCHRDAWGQNAENIRHRFPAGYWVAYNEHLIQANDMEGDLKFYDPANPNGNYQVLYCRTIGPDVSYPDQRDPFVWASFVFIYRQ